MKKCYIVRLENDKGEVAFHVRMKGIPASVIVNRANELYSTATQCYIDNGLVKPIQKQSPPDSVGSRIDDAPYSIMELYKALFEGQIIEFDLVKGNHPCFDIKFGAVHTKDSFIRRIGISVNQSTEDEIH